MTDYRYTGPFGAFPTRHDAIGEAATVGRDFDNLTPKRALESVSARPLCGCDSPVAAIAHTKCLRCGGLL